MMVVDASAVVARLLRTAGGDAIDLDADLHAPEVCDLEVVSSLRRGVREQRLRLERAAEALSDYVELPLTLHGHRPLLARCFALVDNFTPYDASYVALAERLGAPFLTFDRGLQRAVSEHTRVELVWA
jgi:predicted nucleic acid-binding protein